MRPDVVVVDESGDRLGTAADVGGELTSPGADLDDGGMSQADMFEGGDFDPGDLGDF